MAAHNLTTIAYQHLFLFVIAVKLRHIVLWYTPSFRDRLHCAVNATPSLPAMNPEKIKSLFAARLGVFDPISGQQTDADLTQFRKELTTILLPLPYDVEKGNQKFMGLVMYEDGYKQLYCSKLPTSTKPFVYYETIPNDAANVVLSKAEAVHTAKITDYLLFAAAKRKTRDFILEVI